MGQVGALENEDWGWRGDLVDGPRTPRSLVTVRGGRRVAEVEVELLRMGTGGEGGSGRVIPAARRTEVGLSMYFSTRRSLFHERWRRRRLAVLA